MYLNSAVLSMHIDKEYTIVPTFIYLPHIINDSSHSLHPTYLLAPHLTRSLLLRQEDLRQVQGLPPNRSTLAHQILPQDGLRKMGRERNKKRMFSEIPHPLHCAILLPIFLWPGGNIPEIPAIPKVDNQHLQILHRPTHLQYMLPTHRVIRLQVKDHNTDCLIKPCLLG